MPKVSFTDTGEQIPESDNTTSGGAVEAQTTALTEAPNTALATPSTGIQMAGLDGDFQASDIKLPRVSLVQKTSAAVDAGVQAGSLIFKQGDDILQLPNPLPCTVLHLRKQYQEDLPYGAPETPRVFDTAAEVRQAGGTTQWGEENYFKQIAHVQLLFEQPPGIPEEWEDYFPYEFGGSHYAIAMYTLSGSAYTNAAKPIITAAMGPLRGALHSGKWSLGADLKRHGGNTWYAPTMKMQGRHTPEFVEFAAQFAS